MVRVAIVSALYHGYVTPKPGQLTDEARPDSMMKGGGWLETGFLWR